MLLAGTPPPLTKFLPAKSGLLQKTAGNKGTKKMCEFFQARSVQFDKYGCRRRERGRRTEFSSRRVFAFGASQIWYHMVSYSKQIGRGLGTHKYNDCSSLQWDVSLHL